MSREDILKKLGEIFCEDFDDDDLVITMDTEKDEIEEWDSFEQIRLISSIEEKFEVKFTLDEIDNLNNVKSIVESLYAKLN